MRKVCSMMVGIMEALPPTVPARAVPAMCRACSGHGFFPRVFLPCVFLLCNGLCYAMSCHVDLHAPPLMVDLRFHQECSQWSMILTFTLDPFLFCFKVERIGPMHQAGSDSLLTEQVICCHFLHSLSPLLLSLLLLCPAILLSLSSLHWFAGIGVARIEAGMVDFLAATAAGAILPVIFYFPGLEAARADALRCKRSRWCLGSRLTDFGGRKACFSP